MGSVIGKGVVRRRGGRVALLVFGVQLAEAMKVGREPGRHGGGHEVREAWTSSK